nr:ABC transporter substrate binding protein [Roseburia zhanii]
MEGNRKGGVYGLYKKCLFSFFLVLIVSSLWGESIVAGFQKEEKRVLFISSYSYAWETVPQQIEGIQEALSDEASIDYKFMDTKNLTSEESSELFYQSMRQYLSEVDAYDGVIVGDDAAFLFALDHQQELFSDIPIIFEGVNDLQKAAEASAQPLITGVAESLSYENTIKIATELYPDAKEIVGVLDDTITGESERREFYSFADKFPDYRFSEINAAAYSREELAEKVAGYDESTILIYIMCSMDKNGHVYNGNDGVALVSENADIPTFSIVSIGMGSGVLGGEIVSQKQMGYLAAQMLKQYFHGKNIRDIKMIAEPPWQFCFDENVMRRFDIRDSQMPENSEYVNHRETFTERNKQMIQIAAIIVTVLTLLILMLAFDNLKRRRLYEALEKAKTGLEHAASYDVLTGLKNRGMFMKKLQQKIEKGDEFGIILFDLDNFKHINDSLGHNNGDVVLKEIARRSVELEDFVFEVYRLAGDEFTAIVSSNQSGIVREYAESVQGIFKKTFVLEDKEYMLHSSIGIAMCPKDGKTPKEVVAAADAAMYRVKNAGKDDIAFYEERHSK